jgi:hypothetical protein
MESMQLFKRMADVEVERSILSSGGPFVKFKQRWIGKAQQGLGITSCEIRL